jgi:hypothetical protein
MNEDYAAIIAVWLVAWVACAMISAQIACRRGLRPGPYFAVGLLLGVIGIVVAAVMPVARHSEPDPFDEAKWRWRDPTAGPTSPATTARTTRREQAAARASDGHTSDK